MARPAPRLHLGEALLWGWLAVGCAPAVHQIRAPVVPPQPSALTPAGARVAYLRGAVLDARGDPSDAAMVWRDAQSLDPSSAWLRVHRADLALSLGDLAGASALLDEAVALDAGCAPAWALRAVVRALEGDAAGADAADETALRLDPGLWQAAADLAQRAVASGDLARARAVVVAWVARPTQGAAALAARGEARLTTGDLAGGQADLAAALLLGAADPAVRDHFLDATRRSSRYQTGLSVAARASAAAPGDLGLLTLWADVAALSGDPLAMAASQAALRAEVPGWTHATDAPTGRGRAPAGDPALASVAAALAAAKASPASIPDAQAALEAALEAFPADPDLWASLAGLLREEGKVEQAALAEAAHVRYARAWGAK